MSFFRELTYRSDPSTDFMLDGSNDECVAIGGFVDIAPHLGAEIPQSPKLGAVNGRFHANCTKYLNCHSIKTTTPIRTKFCHQVLATKYSSCIHPNTHPNPRCGRLPCWKPLNRDISATDRPIMTKFGFDELRFLAPFEGSTVTIPNFWKFKKAAAAILKITKFAISQQRFDQSSRNVASWCRMSQPLKHENFENPRWGRPPF